MEAVFASSLVTLALFVLWLSLQTANILLLLVCVSDFHWVFCVGSFSLALSFLSVSLLADDNKVIVWELETAKKYRVLVGHTKPVSALDFK
jgi:hypothetical protein